MATPSSRPTRSRGWRRRLATRARPAQAALPLDVRRLAGLLEAQGPPLPARVGTARLARAARLRRLPVPGAAPGAAGRSAAPRLPGARPVRHHRGLLLALLRPR